MVLLLCDKSPEGRGRKTNAEISNTLGLSERTIESVKKRFVEGGIPLAPRGEPKTVNPKPIKFDGEFEARLIALACGPPPEGRARRTVRLLADKAAEIGTAPEGVSRMSAPKKTKLGLNLRKRRKIPPEQNAECAANMEDALEVCHRPYDPNEPVIRVDESNKQLVPHARDALPMEPGKPLRADDERARHGVATSL